MSNPTMLEKPAEAKKTYAIRGLPHPAKVKWETETIPYVPYMPFRYEISSIVPKAGQGDALVWKQWTLFVLALERFKAMPVNQQLSYFQVAGIHGEPATSWDGALPPGKGKEYCQHNTLLFPTWHRPYMLLFERRVWENMHEVIESFKLNESDREEWQQAANYWRMPYWDWARKQRYTDGYDDFGLPEVFTERFVEIQKPNSEPEKRANPLWFFQNPEKDEEGKPLAMGHMPKNMTQWDISDDGQGYPWSRCSGTSRWGITSSDGGKNYEGLDGVNNWELLNKNFREFSSKWYNPFENNPNEKLWKSPGTLADAVNRMFSARPEESPHSWRAFASTKWLNEPNGPGPLDYLSLEYIHNNVHNISGGSRYQEGLGHMSDIAVAAFDPVFWLHHCNVDRQLAIWQALYWPKWWDSHREGDKSPDDPLTPFHNVPNGDEKHGFWTSTKARDWTRLSYQYNDLAPRSRDAIKPDGRLDEAVYKKELLAYIHETYRGTRHYVQDIRHGRPEDRHRFFGHDREDWDDYIINVVYDRYAHGGRSYAIEFWLGGESDDPDSVFLRRENLVGLVYALGRGSGNCTNCRSQRDKGVLSAAQVHLTIPVMSQALDGSYHHIANATRDHVKEYLKRHLHCRIVPHLHSDPDANQPRHQPKVEVLAGTGRPQYTDDDETLPELPPLYEKYEFLLPIDKFL